MRCVSWAGGMWLSVLVLAGCGADSPYEYEKTPADLVAVDGFTSEAATLPPNRRVAVLSFTADASVPGDTGAHLRDNVCSIISDMYHVTLVEREKLEQVLEQMAINQDDLHRQDDKAVEAGSLLQAEYIITGTVGGASVRKVQGRPVWQSCFMYGLDMVEQMTGSATSPQGQRKGQDETQSFRMDASVRVTLQIKDVNTADVKNSVTVVGEDHDFSATSKLDDKDFVIQKAIQDAMSKLRPHLQYSLPLRCTVVEMRDDRRLIKVNAGYEQGIEVGQEMALYAPESAGDGEKQRFKKVGRAEVMIVESDCSWLETDADQRESLRLGCRAKSVAREAEGGFMSSFMKFLN
ncbi:MAG: hypothetical protein AB7F75_09995 [Planctomycetota bacterium]